jgi:hypothetical protein
VDLDHPLDPLFDDVDMGMDLGMDLGMELGMDPGVDLGDPPQALIAEGRVEIHSGIGDVAGTMQTPQRKKVKNLNLKLMSGLILDPCRSFLVLTRVGFCVFLPQSVHTSIPENQPPSSLQPMFAPRSVMSPATSFSRLLLSQDEEPQPLIDITAKDQNQNNREIRKIKRTRLVLDARTELTDEELKVTLQCRRDLYDSCSTLHLRLLVHNICKDKTC